MNPLQPPNGKPRNFGTGDAQFFTRRATASLRNSPHAARQHHCEMFHTPRDNIIAQFFTRRATTSPGPNKSFFGNVYLEPAMRKASGGPRAGVYLQNCSSNCLPPIFCDPPSSFRIPPSTIQRPPVLPPRCPLCCPYLISNCKSPLSMLRHAWPMTHLPPAAALASSTFHRPCLTPRPRRLSFNVHPHSAIVWVSSTV